jgi:hypothetical protein
MAPFYMKTVQSLARLQSLALEHGNTYLVRVLVTRSLEVTVHTQHRDQDQLEPSSGYSEPLDCTRSASVGDGVCPFYHRLHSIWPLPVPPADAIPLHPQHPLRCLKSQEGSKWPLVSLQRKIIAGPLLDWSEVLLHRPNSSLLRVMPGSPRTRSRYEQMRHWAPVV